MIAPVGRGQNRWISRHYRGFSIADKYANATASIDFAVRLAGSGSDAHSSTMSDPKDMREDPESFFAAPDWYDRSINWPARLKREIPVLIDILGPPGEGGILDAGCGTGRQACALAQQGYRVVGADLSPEMLEVAARVRSETNTDVRFVTTPYASLADAVGTGFDGLFCLANALAAAGSRDAVAGAIANFARCLRVGGRIYTQILNFAPMKEKVPCVRGPRIATVDGQEYISVRQFHFGSDAVQVTNVTMWKDDTWNQRAHCGMLYPASLDELSEWCAGAGLRIDETWGGYDRSAFDPTSSADLILVATRTK